MLKKKFWWMLEKGLWKQARTIMPRSLTRWMLFGANVRSKSRGPCLGRPSPKIAYFEQSSGTQLLKKAEKRNQIFEDIIYG